MSDDKPVKCYPLDVLDGEPRWKAWPDAPGWWWWAWVDPDGRWSGVESIGVLDVAPAFIRTRARVLLRDEVDRRDRFTPMREAPPPYPQS